MNSTQTSDPEHDKLKFEVTRLQCEREHLFFSRFFFKERQNMKFRVNWHHRLMSDTVDKVISGEYQNVCITVPPGSSKTELIVINLMARGLALNPWARFLHLSGSDSLALLNSDTAREIVRSDKYQAMWPMRIAEDADSKKRWNVEIDGKKAGGVYATSLGGQITGFRAGHMTEGFQGAIIIDDPIKPEDAFSKTKLENANRRLVTTVKSRKANPNTPIIIVMQRLSNHDPVAYVKEGHLGKNWTYINIPALIDEKYVDALDAEYSQHIDEEPSKDGRFSYWEYKEPLELLLAMEKGEGGKDAISRHVFSSQYQQSPQMLGGNIIKGEYFKQVKMIPNILYRMIYADTAQKTKESNDFTVFECWGMGEDGKIYLLDMIRGKWESPELRRQARAFWMKHRGNAKAFMPWFQNIDRADLGQLRKMGVEDKSSGTGLIQDLRQEAGILIKEIDRKSGGKLDKYSRLMDVLVYIESGFVCVPEDAPFTPGFIAECEAFTANDTHDFDDQVDPLVDACAEMLSSLNKLKTWERMGEDNDE